MKIVLACAVALIPLLIEAPAFAAGRLEAKFDYPMGNDGRRTDGGRALVEFRISNPGDAPITYSIAQLPIAEENGYLTNNMLRVTDPDGNEAAYRGLFVSYSDRGKSAQKVLAPGAIRTSTVDLLKNYQLRAGVIYHVELRFGASYGEDAGGHEPAATPRRRSGDAGSILVWLDPLAESQCCSPTGSVSDFPD